MIKNRFVYLIVPFILFLIFYLAFLRNVDAVPGTASFQGNVATISGQLAAGQFVDSQNTAYFLDPAASGNSLIVAGNVGIGTMNPGSILEVHQDGDANNFHIARFINTNTGTSAVSGVDIVAGTGSNGYGGLLFYTSNNYAQYGLAPNTFSILNTLNAPLRFGNNNAEKMRIDTGGNVGIGTTAPIGKLQVSQSDTSNGMRGISDIQSSDTVHSGVISIGKTRGTITSPTTIADGDYVGRLQFSTYGSAFVSKTYIDGKVNGTVSGNTIPVDMIFATNDAERVRIKNDGNVGIGTTNPQVKLDVGGAVKLVSTNNGNVNIGSQDSTNEGAEVSMVGSGSNNTYFMDVYQNDARNFWNDANDHILYLNNYGAGKASLNVEGTLTMATSQTLDLGSANNTGFTVKIPTRTAGNPTCSSGGSVGLLFKDAAGSQWSHLCNDSQLNSGAGWFAKSFNPDNTDLAENYSLVDDATAGDVVQIAKNNDPKIYPIEKANNETGSAVLGIISTNPGINLTGISENNGKTLLVNPQPVTLSGRAPVKVANINGEINIGDLISTSSTLGFGAKMTNAGVTIGTALENFYPDKKNCTRVTSFENIRWPKDDGNNPSKPCFELPDGTYVGKIMLYVSRFYYDPSVIPTSTKDLTGVNQINKLKELSAKAVFQQKEIDELRKEIQELKNK